MKNQLKNIAFYPISLLYGWLTGCRNFLFNINVIPNTSFQIPVISIGNLAVGGTGKTPHTEFILRLFQDEWNVAMLSRGYKRKTKGFLLAAEHSDSNSIGDEPYQIHLKFPKVRVAVDESRVNGVNKLLSIYPDLQLVVLDDAFQHRHIRAGISILLTDYSNLYTRDLLLPAGTLREWKSGSKRADIIIVTKCPLQLKPIEMRILENEIKPENNQLLFYSGLVYEEIKPVFPDDVQEIMTLKKIAEKKASILFTAGIVQPEPVIEYLGKFTPKIDSLLFEDHHAFTSKDYGLIVQKFESSLNPADLFIVTEKDASRFMNDHHFPELLKSKTYSIPVRVEILNKQEQLFIQKIKNYVVENSRNS